MHEILKLLLDGNFVFVEVRKRLDFITFLQSIDLLFTTIASNECMVSSVSPCLTDIIICVVVITTYI